MTTDTPTLTIVAKMKAAPGKADALGKAMRTLVTETRQEAGCIHYDLFRGTEDDHTFVFVEAWESKAHWEVHRTGEAMRAYKERISSEMIVERDVMQLHPVD